MMNDVSEFANATSQIGREWLLNLSQHDSAHSSQALPPSIVALGVDCDVIAIPHLDLLADPTASPRPFDDLGAVATGAMPIVNERRVSTAGPTADIAEDPSEWVTDPRPGTPRESPSPVPEKSDSVSGHSSRSPSFLSAVEGLTDTILVRFPLASPTVLLFVSSEENPLTDSVCKQVARSLAGCNVGNVLLVDSHRHGALTEECGMVGVDGVTNLIQNDLESDGAWGDAVVRQEAANLYFLPVGNQAWDRWGGTQRVRSATAQMKQHYQFVCVSAGEAHSPAAKLWSGICDGSYLLVNMKNSNPSVAKSAVSVLQTSGSRLLGCVVTDAA